MQINLTVKAGPHEGAIFAFKQRANFVVGRSERAHFRLPVKEKPPDQINDLRSTRSPSASAALTFRRGWPPSFNAPWPANRRPGSGV